MDALIYVIEKTNWMAYCWIPRQAGCIGRSCSLDDLHPHLSEIQNRLYNTLSASLSQNLRCAYPGATFFGGSRAV